MKDKITLKKTLGPVSASFIDELQRAGKTLFDLGEATKIYGKPRPATAKFLSALVKRGVLARIKSGVYLILQMGQESTQLGNWPIIAAELAGTDEYFLSHYSAMRLHGATTHPLLDVYITMPKRRHAKRIAHITYHFIYAKPMHFWGGHSHWATRQDEVYLSDIERTLLDGLERPDLCGGIKEVVRMIWLKHKEINWMKMLKYAEVFRTKAAVKRLGYILEILDFSDANIQALAKIIAKSKGYVLLDPSGIKQGKYLSRWHLQLNMDIAELKMSVWG